MENNAAFSYSYSAPQNQEVLAIRSKYLPRQETELEELKRLDRNVQMAGTTESLSVGVIGCLIFGLGMCLAMQVIGSSMVLGVIIGVVGAAVMLCAYPLYCKLSGNAKAKLTPRILELSDKLINYKNEG